MGAHMEGDRTLYEADMTCLLYTSLLKALWMQLIS